MKKLRWFEKFTASDFDRLISLLDTVLRHSEPEPEYEAWLKAMVTQLSKLQADLYPGGNK